MNKGNSGHARIQKSSLKRSLEMWSRKNNPKENALAKFCINKTHFTLIASDYVRDQLNISYFWLPSFMFPSFYFFPLAPLRNWGLSRLSHAGQRKTLFRMRIQMPVRHAINASDS